MAGSKCVSDPVTVSLQNKVSEYYYNCYARMRWEVLGEYIDEASFQAHTEDGESTQGLAGFQALLEKETQGVESMSVECLGFAAVTDEVSEPTKIQSLPPRAQLHSLTSVCPSGSEKPGPRRHTTQVAVQGHHLSYG